MHWGLSYFMMTPTTIDEKQNKTTKNNETKNDHKFNM